MRVTQPRAILTKSASTEDRFRHRSEDRKNDAELTSLGEIRSVLLNCLAQRIPRFEGRQQEKPRRDFSARDKGNSGAFPDRGSFFGRQRLRIAAVERRL